jgi:hypothetical protein
MSLLGHGIFLPRPFQFTAIQSFGAVCSLRHWQLRQLHYKLMLWGAILYRPLDTTFSFSHHLSASVTLTSHKFKALLYRQDLISLSLSRWLQLYILTVCSCSALFSIASRLSLVFSLTRLIDSTARELSSFCLFLVFLFCWNEDGNNTDCSLYTASATSVELRHQE